MIRLTKFWRSRTRIHSLRMTMPLGVCSARLLFSCYKCTCFMCRPWYFRVFSPCTSNTLSSHSTSHRMLLLTSSTFEQTDHVHTLTLALSLTCRFALRSGATVNDAYVASGACRWVAAKQTQTNEALFKCVREMITTRLSPG